LRPAPKTSAGLFVQLVLTLAIGCLALVWGIATLPGSKTADDYRDIEGRLLHFETFGTAILARVLESPDSRALEACDTHSQRAILLLEMPLADAALRSGATDEFDRRVRSLEARSRQILSCTPRESFVWLVAFDLEVLHGVLNEHAFDLLAMSYQTSPNEAWISIRRNAVAMPFVPIAPEPVRQEILSEFQRLVRFGFVEVAARTYLNASAPTRLLLQARVEQLAPSKQRAFSVALEQLGS
jgi:hypothetical protein